MQSYWSALQFAPTNLPIFYRGMPQVSHGITQLIIEILALSLAENRDLKIPRNRCTGAGSVPVHVKCSYA